MRLIGHLKTEASARKFGDYLTSLNIRNLVEGETEGWAVWVYAEDQIEAGHVALAGYLENPNDSKFQKASEAAAAIRQRERKTEAEVEKRVRTASTLWPASRFASATMILIGVSVLVTAWYKYAPGQVAGLLMISQVAGMGFLPEVRKGEVWRLITPIFMHMNLTHLLFDMMALNALGTLVEVREGTGRFLWMVALLGMVSNVGEYTYQYTYNGPGFGGMSGVVYGLFGYAWVRGKVDAGSGYYLDGFLVTMMLVWFFLCVLDVIPGVANAAHTVGLGAGMLWGALPLLRGGK